MADNPFLADIANAQNPFLADLAAKPPAPTYQPASAWQSLRASPLGRVLEGAVVDPLEGGAQIAAHGINYVFPTKTGTAITNAIDTGAKAEQADYEGARQATDYFHKTTPAVMMGRQAPQSPNFDWLRLGGTALGPETGAVERATTYLPKATSLGGKVLNSAIVGSLFGGLQPVTSGDYAPTKAAQIGLGALTGPAMQLLHAGGGGVANLASHLFEPISTRAGTVAPNTTSAAENAVGRILTKAAGPSGATFDTAPIPGMGFNTAVATNNPGIRGVYRTIGQNTNAASHLASDADTAASNDAINQAITSLGNRNAIPPSERLFSELSNSFENARDATSDVWKRANIDQTAPVASKPFKDTINNYIASLPEAHQESVPSLIPNVLGKMGDTTNLRNVQALRSVVGGQANAAYRSGNDTLGGILGSIRDKISDFADDPANWGNATTADYSAARDATRVMKQTFVNNNSNPVVKKVVGGLIDGKIQPSQAADAIFKSPENLQAYMTATKDNPFAQQAMRDAFAERFATAGQTTSRDAQGNFNFSYPSIQRFINNNQHVVDSGLFTPDQKALIGRISDAADMASRPNRPIAKGGPDTASKLLGNKFVDAILTPTGKMALKMGGAAAGYIGGHMFGEGQIPGMIAGYYGGSEIANRIFEAPRERATALLVEAMKDPDIAKALMMKASSQNEAFIPKLVKSKIFNILGFAGPAGQAAVRSSSGPVPVPAGVPLGGQ